MLDYLHKNLFQGLKTPPWRGPLKAWLPLPFFTVFSLSLGLGSGLYQPVVLDSALFWFLPLSLIVFPSLLEEAFFRGILIPRDVARQGTLKTVLAVISSTLIFVLWHPFNALLFNEMALTIFLDPVFLVIVAALGLSCAYAYIESGSLWVPIIMHWATVVVWVLFLGGRNLILEI